MCQPVKISENRVLREAWFIGSSPIFQLRCPDLHLIKPIVDKLGPATIISDDPNTFDTDVPNPGGFIEHIDTLGL